MRAKEYSRFKKIDDRSKLAGFLNNIMKSLDIMRLLCTPASFKKDPDIGTFQEHVFCNFIRYELWMHGIVGHLRRWTEAIDRYFMEFEGSWRYYAASARLARIMQFGASGEDFDENGDIRKTNLTDEELTPFSIIKELCKDGEEDIVMNTVPLDVKEIANDIIADSKTNYLQGLRTHFGDSIKFYKKDDDGTLEEMTSEDHDMKAAERQADGEVNASMLMAVAGGISGIISMMRLCKPSEDNGKRLQAIRDSATALLDMDFEVLGLAIRKFQS